MSYRQPSGAAYTSFGSSGKVTTDLAIGNDLPVGLKVLADGKVILGGGASIGASTKFGVVRYQATLASTLDSSFGSSGKVVTSVTGLSSTNQVSGMFVDTTGEIFLAGFTSNNVGDNSDILLVKYTANGVADFTFGTAGVVQTSVNSIEGGSAVAIGQSSRPLVVGYGKNGSVFDFMLLRYTTTGSVDPSFGTSGKVYTSFGNATNNIGNRIVVQTDGKILVAGTSDNGTTIKFAIARYLQ